MQKLLSLDCFKVPVCALKLRVGNFCYIYVNDVPRDTRRWNIRQETTFGTHSMSSATDSENRKKTCDLLVGNVYDKHENMYT